MGDPSKQMYKECIFTGKRWTNYQDASLDALDSLDDADDTYDSKIQSTLYSLDSNNRVVLSIIPGVLKLSSKNVKTTDTRGYIMKEFEPAFGYLPRFMVKTDKIRDYVDKYVIVKIIHTPPSVDKVSGVKIAPSITGTIERYLGDVGDVAVENTLCRIFATSSWSRKFDRIKAETEYEKQGITQIDLTPNRGLHGGLYIVSVDPEGSKDIDDAISIEQLSDSSYRIGVHIADPSSYLVENSPFDCEMLKRAESVYLNDETIHMFPHELSTSVFFLDSSKPFARAFSVFINLFFENGNYSIISVDASKTLIKISENTTYEKFQKEIETDSRKKLMYDVGEIIRAKLFSHTNGRDSYDSKKMIETFMVLANMSVAEKMVELVNGDKRYPILIRSQIKPNDSSVDSIHTDTLVDDGLSFKILIEQHNQLKMNRAELRYYTAPDSSRCNDSNDKYDLCTDNPNRHHALGVDLYTHFTSPIRRYSDILVHRLLYNLITGSEVFNLQNLRRTEGFRVDTMFILNHQKGFYRKIYQLEKEISITHTVIETIGRVPTERTFKLKGVVVDVNNDQTRYTVRCTDIVFDADMNSVYGQTLLNKIADKFKGSLHNLVLKDYRPDSNDQHSIRYKLFQRINYRACFLALNVRKIRTFC